MTNKNNKKPDDVLLQEAFNDVYKHSILMGVRYNWQIIAATLVAVGLKIYKSVLKDDEFVGMMNTIRDNMEDVKPFDDKKTLH
tara:strand:+ start:349 stop:597 length:249 start_codon:yes stop_codon:yes gene_type:complete